MTPPSLNELLRRYPKILTECAVAERLRRMPEVTLHPLLYNTPLIYGPEDARARMVEIYEEYVGVARDAGLPLLLTAPTWRLDAERVAGAGVPASINTDAVGFLRRIRDGSESREPLLVGALVGPRNDCYRPDLAPDSAASEAFHDGQIRELADAGAEFLLAQTLPSVGEALGMARAMSRTGVPYVISFCTGMDGRVLDGTPLPEAMAMVDDNSQLSESPVGFFVNCTHPRFILDAHRPGQLVRLIGIQANASSKDVTRLDGSGATEADPVDAWVRSMAELHEKHGVTILGGCCGTSLEHLVGLARIPSRTAEE